VESVKTGDDEFKITLDAEELLTICRCIAETRSHLPDWEFPIRVGAETKEADAILTMLQDAAGNGPVAEK
jgi:hypothetical protein